MAGRAALLLASLLPAAAAGAHAQVAPNAPAVQTAGDISQIGSDAHRAEHDARRSTLASRIDSLVLEHRRISRLLEGRASTHSPVIATDTVAVGPFLFVNRSAPPATAVTALEHAWRDHQEMIGNAAQQLSGTVISLDLNHADLRRVGAPETMHHLAPPLGGRASYASAASHTVLTALIRLMPDSMQQWVSGGGLFRDDAMMWAYRDLATTGSTAGRACFARDMQACAVALTGDAWRVIHPTTRTSLLQHALALGGAGSYERLLRDAPTSRPGWQMPQGSRSTS